jgi:hypothetical protein
MNAETLAKKLNGREYGSEITREEATEAKVCGLVVVYGASDDLMEFEGAIYDEADCYEGGKAYVSSEGKLVKKKSGQAIKATWCPRDGEGNVYASWLIDTDIPHHKFDIMEDGELYCRGLIFSLSDVQVKN